MPSFVVIIGCLSLISFLSSILILNQECHRLAQLTEPFGGTPGRFAEQGLRLIFSLLFTLLSVTTLGISAALIWLGSLPNAIG